MINPHRLRLQILPFRLIPGWKYAPRSGSYHVGQGSLLHLQHQQSENHIRTVEWFTFEDCFQSDLEPKLISLLPFKQADTPGRKSVARWLYLDVEKRIPRGVLAIRILTSTKTAYILEFQRRITTRISASGKIESKEESYKGLVFSLREPDNFEVWLRRYLAEIRHAEGIVYKLARHCPGEAHAFNHIRGSGEAIRSEAAIRNALRKIGVL